MTTPTSHATALTAPRYTRARGWVHQGRMISPEQAGRLVEQRSGLRRAIREAVRRGAVEWNDPNAYLARREWVALGLPLQRWRGWEPELRRLERD